MGKRGKIEDEDTALWEQVAGTASPLKQREPAPRSKGAVSPGPKVSPAAAHPPRRPAPPAPKPAHAARPVPLDRQTARQLAAGRIEVEAHLDLHGLRQRDAHAQLRRFLKSAQARGLRHVLVITGKGAPAEAPTSFYEEKERGVLRAAVPRWLAEPDFARLVVNVSPAPRRLGGDGALYVRLRKARSS